MRLIHWLSKQPDGSVSNAQLDEISRGIGEMLDGCGALFGEDVTHFESRYQDMTKTMKDVLSLHNFEERDADDSPRKETHTHTSLHAVASAGFDGGEDEDEDEDEEDDEGEGDEGDGGDGDEGSPASGGALRGRLNSFNTKVNYVLAMAVRERDQTLTGRPNPTTTLPPPQLLRPAP